MDLATGEQERDCGESVRRWNEGRGGGGFGGKDVFVDLHISQSVVLAHFTIQVVVIVPHCGVLAGVERMGFLMSPCLRSLCPAVR